MNLDHSIIKMIAFEIVLYLPKKKLNNFGKNLIFVPIFYTIKLSHSFCAHLLYDKIVPQLSKLELTILMKYNKKTKAVNLVI